MHQSQNKQHVVDVLFVLTLFCIFTAASLLLVVMGARIYKNTVANMNKHYESRTSESYITEKFRQFDSSDNIRMTTLEDVEALGLYQTIDDVSYCTYLYYYDGYLCELLMKEGSNIGTNAKEAGEKILELSSYQVTVLSDSLYQIDFSTVSGEKSTFFLHSRSN